MKVISHPPIWINCNDQFIVTNVVTVLIPFWGMLGIWSNKIGWVSTMKTPLLIPIVSTPLDSIVFGSSGMYDCSILKLFFKSFCIGRTISFSAFSRLPTMPFLRQWWPNSPHPGSITWWVNTFHYLRTFFDECTSSSDFSAYPIVHRRWLVQMLFKLLLTGQEVIGWDSLSYLPYASPHPLSFGSALM